MEAGRLSSVAIVPLFPLTNLPLAWVCGIGRGGFESHEEP